MSKQPRTAYLASTRALADAGSVLAGLVLTSTVLAFSVLACSASPAVAGVPSPFGQDLTYQGELAFGGVPVNGTCDFRIEVWDAFTGGSSVDANTDPGVEVVDGRFTARVLCGDEDCYDGDPRWLEIRVRCPAGAGAFTTLAPRQEVTPAPYAVRAGIANTVPASSITSNAIAAGAVTSDEIADGTIQPADVVGGGLYSQKTQLYRCLASVTFSNAGTHSISASCDDENDLGITGGCQLDGDDLILRASVPSDNSWDTEITSASHFCRADFPTADGADRFIFSVIYCLAVPGP